MLHNLWKQLFFYIILILFAIPTQAHANKLDAPQDSLRVGVAGSEPFVFKNEDRGIALEIWDEIAKSKSWDYKYVPLNNVDDALLNLKKGEFDLVVGPLSITSRRLENMRFSQPFYNSSISILSVSENLSFFEKIKPLFKLKLVMAVGALLIILGIVGTLLWLAERKESTDQFPEDPLKGIGTGMWLAIVTMSTTGYGDKAPVTLAGRIVAGTWMVVSIIFATSMVAGIASTLTLSSLGSTTITNIEQLSGRKAATISDSPSAVFLNKSNINVVGVANLDEALEKLKNREVDAIVYDRPQLLYLLKNNQNQDLYISKAEYYKQGYGFAFPTNSPLITDVNRALLKLSESQKTEEIIYNYIQKDE